MKRGTEHQPFEDEQGLLVAYVLLHKKTNKKQAPRGELHLPNPDHQ